MTFIQEDRVDRENLKSKFFLNKLADGQGIRCYQCLDVNADCATEAGNLGRTVRCGNRASGWTLGQIFEFGTKLEFTTNGISEWNDLCAKFKSLCKEWRDLVKQGSAIVHVPFNNSKVCLNFSCFLL